MRGVSRTRTWKFASSLYGYGAKPEINFGHRRRQCPETFLIGLDKLWVSEFWPKELRLGPVGANRSGRVRGSGESCLSFESRGPRIVPLGLAWLPEVCVQGGKSDMISACASCRLLVHHHWCSIPHYRSFANLASMIRFPSLRFYQPIGKPWSMIRRQNQCIIHFTNSSDIATSTPLSRTIKSL